MLNVLQHLDLLTVGLAVAGIILLGFVIYFNDRDSLTNKVFLLFSLVTAVWGIVNFASYQVNNEIYRLWLVRGVIFFGLAQALIFLILVYVFPRKTSKVPFWFRYTVYPITAFVGVLTLTPYVFKELSVGVGGVASQPVPGPAIGLFGIVGITLVISGFVLLIRKLSHAANLLERKQTRIFFLGTVMMFGLIIVFNLILPNTLGNTEYIPYGAFFVLPFIILTSYSIYKHRLFKIKVAAIAFVAYILTVFSFFSVVYAENNTELVLSATYFILILLGSIILLRAVLNEVEQKEELQSLTRQLEKANAKLKELDQLKTEFLSLASHQLRSPLTAIKGYTSMLLEGSFGKVEEQQKDAINRVYESTQHLTKVVEDLLNVSKIEQGGMKYEMAEFDLEKAARDLATDLSVTAEKKGLKLTFETDNKSPYRLYGDMEKLRQVILNLIDNAIKYTQEGSITVKLAKEVGNFKLDITDTGMGISPEEKEKLFQKFSRGAGGKTNTGGSGLGLYLAKEIVAAHKGRVDITSPGVGKGSTFSIILPQSHA